ncbi:MAG: acyl-CoA dehydrogenase family protein [Syntrophobacteraceae bacterium]|nr:acyl-CoA dehydrogenase family protein [Syntrophobacteraceae bacterium]
MIMENIYRGHFDPELIRIGPASMDEAKVGMIVEQYRQILKDYLSGRSEAEGLLPAELLRKMGDSGFFGLTVETEYGGLGLNLSEYLKVVGEIARLDIPVAFTFLAHLSIGIKALQLFGNEGQKHYYLRKAASGDMIFAFALTEPRIGSDAQHIETTAVMSEDETHYVLNGRKTYITNANYAGGMTVFAQQNPKEPGFIGAFIVETGWDGVQIGKEMPKMGLGSSSTAPVQFRNVRVPKENLIGMPGEGFKIAMSVLNYGRLGLGASSASIMRLSAREMLNRATSRVQFQVPISSFQLIQEKIVRARVGEAVSSAMNNLAAMTLQAHPLLPSAIETSHCKLFGTTRAWEAAYDALQTAGGAGYLKTLPYEKRMRDIRVTTVFEGTTEVHSIYPALWGMRLIAKSLKDAGRSSLSLVGDLLKLLVKGQNWPLFYENSVMQKAFREANRCAKAARVLLLSGLLLYGKKIARGDTANREFLFRRITTLSLYSFGLLALLRETDIKHKAGAVQAEDLRILQYFAAEANQARKDNKRFFDSRKEKVNGALFREYSNSQSEGGDKTGPEGQAATPEK